MLAVSACGRPGLAPLPAEILKSQPGDGLAINCWRSGARFEFSDAPNIDPLRQSHPPAVHRGLAHVSRCAKSVSRNVLRRVLRRAILVAREIRRIAFREDQPFTGLAEPASCELILARRKKHIAPSRGPNSRGRNHRSEKLSDIRRCNRLLGETKPSVRGLLSEATLLRQWNER